MWVTCRYCWGNGSRLTRDEYVTCERCFGNGGYEDGTPNLSAMGGRSHLITVLTALGAGGFIWLQYQNGVLAVITMFVAGYLASTKIGTFVFGIMWILIIAVLVNGLTRT